MATHLGNLCPGIAGAELLLEALWCTSSVRFPILRNSKPEGINGFSSDSLSHPTDLINDFHTKQAAKLQPAGASSRLADSVRL